MTVGTQMLSVKNFFSHFFWNFSGSAYRRWPSTESTCLERRNGQFSWWKMSIGCEVSEKNLCLDDEIARWPQLLHLPPLFAFNATSQMFIMEVYW